MTRRHEEFVLSLYPNVRGLAFVVFVSPLTPVDWGTKDIRGPRKHARMFAAAKVLMKIHRPRILVFEHIVNQGSRSRRRPHRLLQIIHAHAASQALEVRTFTRAQVRQCFVDSAVRTKHQIAQAVATQIPAFDPLLPRQRRRWDAEFYSMGILQAAALGIAFYHHRRTGKAA